MVICNEGETNVKNLAKRVSRFLKSEDGPTAVEYAVMLALIIVACLVVIGSLGTSISSTFNSVDAKLKG
jgi:pilus assembly protein Flp/PilA